MNFRSAVPTLTLGLAAVCTSALPDPIVFDGFSGYPDDALISASPAGPALGLTGDWALDSESDFYVNRTEADHGAGTGKAVYDRPSDDNGARTAQRSTSADHVLFSVDGDIFHASFLIDPARSSGDMMFMLRLDQLNGGGQADVSFGIKNGRFIVGNSGVDVDASGGTPGASEMLVVLRVEYGDAGNGPDDNELVTLWVDPQDEFSLPAIDNVPVNFINRGGGQLTAVAIRAEHMAGQPAFFDDLRVGTEFADVVQTASFDNDLAGNGLFFDPNNPGHGFDFNVHESGLTVFYYGHTAGGERLWLISSTFTGDLHFGNPVELTMYEVISGVFGSPVHQETAWGTITVLLADCDTGHASFDGMDGQFEMDFVRLAGLPGIDCQ